MRGAFPPTPSSVGSALQRAASPGQRHKAGTFAEPRRAGRLRPAAQLAAQQLPPGRSPPGKGTDPRATDRPAAPGRRRHRGRARSGPAQEAGQGTPGEGPSGQSRLGEAVPGPCPPPGNAGLIHSTSVPSQGRFQELRACPRCAHGSPRQSRAVSPVPAVPVIVLLAVDAAVLAEAGELGLQVEFTFAALQAAHVPLFVHSQEVITVGDFTPAAGAQGSPVTADGRHGLLGENNYRPLARGRNS